MWLNNIKDWIRLSVDDLLDSTQDRTQLVRFVMSPKRVWRDFCVQIELGVEIANLGGE